MRNPPRPLLAALVAVLAFAVAAAAPTANKPSPTLKEVERLAGEQKHEEAAKLSSLVLEAARAAGDEQEWTRALVKQTQLRTALHGYETSVRLLKDTPWPKGEPWRSVLSLYYARELVTYARAYSWEVGQRERVDTKGVVDLKAWTRDQLYAEAQKAYQDVWSRREELGKEPVAKLAEFLEPNTFPAGVRGTLRDAVSYLRVELLADTTGWRPEQSNDVYRLDRAALIKGDPAASAKVALDDPEVHPLLKIGSIFDDLESWNTSAGKREAVLEARLERATRLSQSFTEEADKALVVADLEKRLSTFVDVPWWSWGMGTLADLVRANGKPGALVRARTLALEGQKRYPASPGGQRCNHIVKEIEAPQYQLTAMSSDATGKRSLMVMHKNLPALWLRAYPFDVEKRISEAKNYNLLPDGDEMEALVRAGRPLATWKLELPPTSDYQLHRSYSTPPTMPQGAYLVVASARQDFASASNQLLGVITFVSDVVLVERMAPGEVEATALSGDGGMPLPGVAISLYAYNWSRGHQLVETRTTGAEGSARFKRRDDSNNFFLFARRGSDQALDANYLYFNGEATPSEQTAALVYSDRSVYRPNQKLLWKVVGYKGRSDPARWATLPKQSLTVTLQDANYQAVETKTVVLNDFGSAAGEFLIPAGRMLGRWTVITSLGGAGAVQVEEYKRPTFEVTLKDPEGALRLNREATLDGEARYYFGLPVAAGNARYKVTRTPIYPWWWGFWGYGASVRSQIVASGASSLDADGKFKVTFIPSADERPGEDQQELTYRYVLSVDVTDEGGETRSAERTFRQRVPIDSTAGRECDPDVARYYCARNRAVFSERSVSEVAPRSRSTTRR